MLMDSAESDESFEIAVGITEFANGSAGMRGIMKQRYSDFIVREVLQDGTVCFLKDISGKALEEALFESTGHESVVDSAEVDAAEQIADKLLQAISHPANQEDKSKLVYFIGQCIAKNVDCPESFVTFPDLDKPTRTAVHAAVKVHLVEFVETESFQAEGKTYIKMIAKHKRANSNKRKRAEWPQGVGNFLRFTLLKENIDTMSAVTILNNNLRCNSTANGVAYSGTKDKRGVTVQKCTVYRRKPSDFTRLNASKMMPTILCGDFEYVNEAAQLGDGGGNRFEIVLRALDTSNEADIRTACEAMGASGFVNYFGLQRFGKGGSRSHEFGRAILKSDWEACVRMLFTPRDGDRPNIATAKALFAAGNFAEAAKVMPEALHAEKTVLQRLVNNPTDFMAAYASIPKNARLICAHAYQSYLWNKAASRKLQLHGLQVRPGDLVLRDSSAVGQTTSTDASSGPPVLHVTAEDVAAGKYTVHDVVLPIPGYESLYPANEIGAYYDELFAADGLSRGSYETCHVMYREKGVYRRILQRAQDFEWRAISYTDPDAELAETELSTFRAAKSGLSKAGAETEASSETVKQFWALQVKFLLPPGTYATMLLRELTKASTESEYQAQLTKEAGGGAGSGVVSAAPDVAED